MGYATANGREISRNSRLRPGRAPKNVTRPTALVTILGRAGVARRHRTARARGERAMVADDRWSPNDDQGRLIGARAGRLLGLVRAGRLLGLVRAGRLLGLVLRHDL